MENLRKTIMETIQKIKKTPERQPKGAEQGKGMTTKGGRPRQGHDNQKGADQGKGMTTKEGGQPRQVT